MSAYHGWQCQCSACVVEREADAKPEPVRPLSASGAEKAAEARARLAGWLAPDLLAALDHYLDARELHMWEQINEGGEC